MTCMFALDVMFWLRLSAILCRSAALSLRLYSERLFCAKASTSIRTMAGISASVANLVRISLIALKIGFTMMLYSLSLRSVGKEG